MHGCQILGEGALLFYDIMRWVLRGARGAVGISKDHSFRYRATAEQMVRVGVNSVPIVALLSMFVGMIVAVALAEVLQTWGVVSWTAKVVSVAMTRELSPLITAIVASGFIGASIAAEIGTMVVAEEVTALECSAINPIRFLVVPRIVAAMIMMPALIIISNWAGIVGGYLVGTQLLSIPSAQFIQLAFDAMFSKDIILGVLVRGPVFAAIIVIIACMQGLRVRGGAEGVGRATTSTVVISIIAIIFANLIFSTLFNFVLVDYIPF